MIELLRDLKGFSWHAYLSITMIMSPTRCRVADLALFAEDPAPGKQYPDEPGELAIEIVEQQDRFTEMMQRLSDYHVWGFKRIWLVDPSTYKLFVYDTTGLHEVWSFELAEFGARISGVEIFS